MGTKNVKTETVLDETVLDETEMEIVVEERVSTGATTIVMNESANGEIVVSHRID